MSGWKARCFVAAVLVLMACSGDAERPNGSGGFQITVSGEDLAVNGYDFSIGASVDDDPPPFVDGWEIRFTHVLVTVDHILLTADPDRNPADPQALGDVVARVGGPFAVDAKIGGPILGKSGSPNEKTVEVATINSKGDGSAFDPQQRYGFSYALVTASASAKMVNLDADGQLLYSAAVAKGWSMIYQGVATYRGPTASGMFATLPTVVKFTLGMRNPSTYLNCQNTDFNQLASGEFPRGLQADASRVTTAQITLHTDHAFWSKLNVEGTELHFDPIAANASDAGFVTLDDLVGIDVLGFRTRSGAQLMGRSLVSGYIAAKGELSYDQNSSTLSPVNGYAAYLQYSAASGGHLNADGRCEVRNDFAP